MLCGTKSQFDISGGSSSCAMQCVVWAIQMARKGIGALQTEDVDESLLEATRLYNTAKTKGLWTDSRGHTNLRSIAACMRTPNLLETGGQQEVKRKCAATTIQGELAAMQAFAESAEALSVIVGAYCILLWKEADGLFGVFDSHSAPASVTMHEDLLSFFEEMISSRCPPPDICSCRNDNYFCSACTLSYCAFAVVEVPESLSSLEWGLSEEDQKMNELISDLSELCIKPEVEIVERETAQSETAQKPETAENPATATTSGSNTGDKKRKAPDGELPAKRRRRSRELSIIEKLLVCRAIASGVGRTAVQKHWSIAPTSLALMVSKHGEYEKMLDDCRCNTRTRKRAKGGGAKARFHDVEAKVEAWIKANPTKQLTPELMRDKLIEYLAELHPSKPKTVITDDIVRGAIKRLDLGQKKITHRNTTDSETRMTLIQKFHWHLVSLNTIKVPTIIVNADETPLTPCGRSLAYTLSFRGKLCEVVNNRIAAADIKRFCTVLYSVAAKRDGSQVAQPSPHILFKGLGNVSDTEKAEYAKGVEVGWTKCAVMTSEYFASRYAAYLRELYAGNRVLLVIDKAAQHWTDSVAQVFAKYGIHVVHIPEGTTSDVQVCDTDVFFHFKFLFHQYANAFYLDDKNERPNASTRRVLITQWIEKAHKELGLKVDFHKAMKKAGYFLGCGQAAEDIQLRTLPDYAFQPLKGTHPNTESNISKSGTLYKVADLLPCEHCKLLVTEEHFTWHMEKCDGSGKVALIPVDSEESPEPASGTSEPQPPAGSQTPAESQPSQSEPSCTGGSVFATSNYVSQSKRFACNKPCKFTCGQKTKLAEHQKNCPHAQAFAKSCRLSFFRQRK